MTIHFYFLAMIVTWMWPGKLPRDWAQLKKDFIFMTIVCRKSLWGEEGRIGKIYSYPFPFLLEGFFYCIKSSSEMKENFLVVKAAFWMNPVRWISMYIHDCFRPCSSLSTGCNLFLLQHRWPVLTKPGSGTLKGSSTWTTELFPINTFLLWKWHLNTHKGIGINELGIYRIWQFRIIGVWKEILGGIS